MSGGSLRSGVFVETFLSLAIFHREKKPNLIDPREVRWDENVANRQKKAGSSAFPALFLRGSLRFRVNVESRPDNRRRGRRVRAPRLKPRWVFCYPIFRTDTGTGSTGSQKSICRNGVHPSVLPPRSPSLSYRLILIISTFDI